MKSPWLPPILSLAPRASARRRGSFARPSPWSRLSRGAGMVVLFFLLLAGCSDDGDAGGPPELAWTGDPVAETLYGKVMAEEDDAGTWLWKAIPYAKPPVGSLRWKAPRKPDPWEGIRQEKDFCDTCPQYFFLGDKVVGKEDCLYLNIWRPRTEETDLPVYFWIHGGGNSIGSAVVGDDYDGANLASRSDLVVVTVNYRLGPLGWLTHRALREGVPGSELDDSGNYGTLDLVRALEWVRNNIRAFGGDPDRVLIAGESAGAVNVLSLLLSPAAHGLFQRALVESGGPMWSSVEEGEEGARELLLNLLVKDGTARDRSAAEEVLAGMSNQEIEAYLRSKTPAQLLHGYEPWFGGMITFPNVFVDGTVIPAEGYEAFESGTYPNKVPVMIGTNKEEMKLFLFPDPYFLGKDDLYKVVASYGSDAWKIFGVDQVARALRTHPDQPGVYAYQFLWGAGGDTGESLLPDPWGFKLGSCHGMEIPFFFGNDSIFVFLQALVFTEANRPGREVLTEAMMHYAASFARTGDPNGAGSGLPEWRPWSNEAGGPKCILLDVDRRDQTLDVRMSSVELTAEELQERMIAEVPEPLYSEALEYLSRWQDLLTPPE